jgi:hypothetical protein
MKGSKNYYINSFIVENNFIVLFKIEINYLNLKSKNKNI